MNYLKRLAIAAVPALVLAFGAASTASADHDASGLTAAEKETVSLVHAFEDCVDDKISQVTQADVDAYVQELLDEGYPPIQQLIEQLVAQKFVGGAQESCLVELDIDLDKARADVQELVNKHGEQVLDRPAP